MMPCGECGYPVPEQASFCPQCAAPVGGKSAGHGWEYKSEASLLGLPLLHVSFKYRRGKRAASFMRPGWVPVPAKGIIAIGQSAIGVFAISQFGIGVFSLSQFTVAGIAVGQFALAYNLIAQFGIYLHQGWGQFVVSLPDLLRSLG